MTSPTDEHFASTWREVYSHPGIASLPWYLTVGNHDHHSDNGEWFQVIRGKCERDVDSL